MEQVLRKIYQKETKVLQAARNRKPNSVLVPGIDTLDVIYDLYSTMDQDDERFGINLLFLHGSGMNRIIWEYYLAQIGLLIQDNHSIWKINKAVLLDQVTHGDSAELNRYKLGVDFDWSDGAKDACLVALKEFNTREVNILIGHSMGGHQALACSVICPDLFNLIIPIEPVLIPHVAPTSIRAPTIVHSRFSNAIWTKTKDQFQNEEEYRQFMETESFFKDSKKEIRDRIIEFERVPLKVNGKETIRTKISQQQNMICYMTLNPCASWLIGNLKFITTPVYCIVGGIANWTPKSNSQLLKDEIENIQLEIVPEGDHLLNLEKPDTVIDLIIKRITSLMEQHGNKQESKQNYLTQEQRGELFMKNYKTFCRERISDYSQSRVSKL